ncbi:MAG TPA: recombinase family protein [Bacteroidales bacterium]|nr:recombinase family protein [Bacteroidales bacterium]
MKTAIIYSRVSTSDQDTSSQLNKIRNYCEHHEFSILREFTEKKSGMLSFDEREEMNNLMEWIKTNKVDVLVVWELSRLGRKLKDVLNITTELKEHNISLHSLKENIITLDENGKESMTGSIMISLLSIFSEFERESIVQRSRRGLEYSSEVLGRWTGGNLLPYGYKRENKVLVVDPDEAEIIKLIFNLYLEGKGTQKIAHLLNEKGIKTRYNKVLKKKININGVLKSSDDFNFVDGTIYTILRNSIYKGERRYKGRILKAPSIIDNITFDKVQERLTENYNKKGINTKFNYLLQNIEMRCGECGLTYFPHKRSDGVDNRYICLSKRTHKTDCNNTGIGINKLDDGVWYFIRRTDDLMKHIKNSIDTDEINNQIEKKNHSLKLLKVEKLKIIQNENFLVDMVMKQKMSPDIYEQRIELVMKEKNKLDANAEKLIKEIDGLIEIQKLQSDIDNHIRDIKGNKDLMKKYLTEIISKITIYPIKDNFTIGSVKNDKNVMIELLLKSTPKPIFFIISQRSNAILKIEKENFDFNTYSVIGSKKELKAKIKPIPHHINN